MLRLEPVTSKNWRDAVFLTTDPEHENPLDQQWVTSTAFSMLQAAYEENWDCRVIYDGETAVGFVFYGLWKENRPLLCRYTIDIDQQGRGYGQRALPLVVDQICAQYHSRRVYVTLERANERAVHLYEKFGFRDTGETDENESVFIYDLDGKN